MNTSLNFSLLRNSFKRINLQEKVLCRISIMQSCPKPVYRKDLHWCGYCWIIFHFQAIAIVDCFPNISAIELFSLRSIKYLYPKSLAEISVLFIGLCYSCTNVIYYIVYIVFLCLFYDKTGLQLNSSKAILFTFGF